MASIDRIDHPQHFTWASLDPLHDHHSKIADLLNVHDVEEWGVMETTVVYAPDLTVQSAPRVIGAELAIVSDLAGVTTISEPQASHEFDGSNVRFAGVLVAQDGSPVCWIRQGVEAADARPIINMRLSHDTGGIDDDTFEGPGGADQTASGEAIPDENEHDTSNSRASLSAAPWLGAAARTAAEHARMETERNRVRPVSALVVYCAMRRGLPSAASSRSRKSARQSSSFSPPLANGVYCCEARLVLGGSANGAATGPGSLTRIPVRIPFDIASHDSAMHPCCTKSYSYDQFQRDVQRRAQEEIAAAAAAAAAGAAGVGSHYVAETAQRPWLEGVTVGQVAMMTRRAGPRLPQLAQAAGGYFAGSAAAGPVAGNGQAGRLLNADAGDQRARKDGGWTGGPKVPLEGVLGLSTREEMSAVVPQAAQGPGGSAVEAALQNS